MVPTAKWRNDQAFLALPAVQKLVELSLSTQEDVSHCGVMPLRQRRWSNMIGLTEGQLQSALDGLVAAGRFVIDEDLEELLIRGHIREDRVYKQPNVLRSAERELSSIASMPMREALAEDLRALAETVGADMPKGSLTILGEMRAQLPKGSPNPSGNPSGTLPETPPGTLPEGSEEPPAKPLGDRGKGTGELPDRSAQASTSSCPDTASGGAEDEESGGTAKATKAKREIPKADQEPRPDVDEICQALVDHRVRLGCKQPTITQEWRTEARRMFDLDGRPLDEALELLDWSQNNDFWNPNIESITKFRKQYDKLRLSRGREQPKSNVVALRGGARLEQKHAMFARQRAWAEAEDAKEATQ